jgi:hypothetical protein
VTHRFDMAEGLRTEFVAEQVTEQVTHGSATRVAESDHTRPEPIRRVPELSVQWRSHRHYHPANPAPELAYLSGHLRRRTSQRGRPLCQECFARAERQRGSDADHLLPVQQPRRYDPRLRGFGGPCAIIC